MVTMDHDYSKGQMIGLAIWFTIIPLFFFVLRLWAKSIRARRFALDDYLAGAALASTLLAIRSKGDSNTS
jgi:hypothetical protein